ncbi:MAG: SufE family protein [Phycisphaerales bacterium]|jgi:cysteine desulfuration protein SufE|nr:SufE family protein [Phycisphaerales bacterium]
MSTTLPSISEVEEAFAFFEDWEDRYRYIMDLGEKLPAMPRADCVDANLVRGCQSTVWVTMQVDGDSVLVNAQSDSQLVKGLAAIVVIAVTGLTPREIVNLDLEAIFGRLRLHDHLSPTRSNGLHGMVQQVRSRAAALAA